MGRKSPKSKRQLAARSSRKLKKKIHVFSEGAVTETLYFSALARLQRDFAIEFVSKGKVPATLLEEAISHEKKIQRSKNAYTKDDQIWLVFDRDSHPRVDEVISNAKSHEFGIAYSNPCFEVFLLYHYQDYHADENRDAVKARLAEVCEEYCSRREKLTAATAILSHTRDAIVRAEKGLKSRISEGIENGSPSSTAHELAMLFLRG